MFCFFFCYHLLMWDEKEQMAHLLIPNRLLFQNRFTRNSSESPVTVSERSWTAAHLHNSQHRPPPTSFGHTKKSKIKQIAASCLVSVGKKTKKKRGILLVAAIYLLPRFEFEICRVLNWFHGPWHQNNDSHSYEPLRQRALTGFMWSCNSCYSIWYHLLITE